MRAVCKRLLDRKNRPRWMTKVSRLVEVACATGRSPAMADAADYPLNCLDDLSDGFSGWFAVSDPNQCNDFCFWDHDHDTLAQE